jgi:hypothetical protein
MTQEVFIYILDKLRDQEKKLNDLYSLGLDLVNFTDDSAHVITTMLSVYFGKDGEEWISWYLYDRDPDGADDQATIDEKPICYDDQSLWEHVERCRLENKEEYVLPKKLTLEERMEILNLLR